jgi:putative colanic acid biosynthesis glycosyltransferase
MDETLEAIVQPAELSIVTVVRNDLPGLTTTCASLDRIRAGDIEHVIVDGSTNDEIREFLSLCRTGRLKWVSEPDEGIYDAMNKGLGLASGKYVLFLNAGDKIHPLFSIVKLRAQIIRSQTVEPTPVILGYSAEVYGDRQYLNPGLGHEARAFRGPPHQATFYPRHFVETNRYRRDMRVRADGEFTAHAIDGCGAVFLPTIVCEFPLGGVSSSYSNFAILSSRLREAPTRFEQLKVLIKAVLWRTLPRTWFYDLLASYKHTRFTDPAGLPLLANELHLSPGKWFRPLRL